MISTALTDILETKLSKLANSGLESYAEQVAKDYLENNVEPTESIRKITSEKDFTPHEVARLVEISNLLINSYLLSTKEDRTFKFPLANKDKVLNELNRSEKKASVVISQDYYRPPVNEDDSMLKAAFDTEYESKVAGDNDIWNTVEELQDNRNIIDEEMRLNEMQFDAAYEKIAYEVKQMMFENIGMDSPVDRFKDCMEASVKWFPKNASEVKSVLTSIAEDVFDDTYHDEVKMKEECVKIASDGIYHFSNRVPVTGPTALQIGIDTVLQCRDKHIRLQAARNVVDDQVDYVVTNVVPLGFGEVTKTMYSLQRPSMETK